MIQFNKPYYPSSAEEIMIDSLKSNHISGDGKYNKLVSDYFKNKFGFQYNLTTTSCTDALELISLTIGIKEGDEVIMPDFTFVSTANAFLLRGANIIFCDSLDNAPNINFNTIEKLITDKTKAIVIVHYAGVAFDLNKINEIKIKYPHIQIIEDAAQSINTFYQGKPVGSYGDFASFSFHETKNISCGEGGLFVCRSEKDFLKAEVIREKGTNRKNFIKGIVDKYTWKNLGSSFLPSDLLMSILYSQLLLIEDITTKRIELWNAYYYNLREVKELELPFLDKNCKHNGHIFYIILNSKFERDNLIESLKNSKVESTFHYQSLSNSDYFKGSIKKYTSLNNSIKYSDRLIRLPIYHELSLKDVEYICNKIKSHF